MRQLITAEGVASPRGGADTIAGVGVAASRPRHDEMAQTIAVPSYSP